MDSEREYWTGSKEGDVFVNEELDDHFSRGNTTVINLSDLGLLRLPERLLEFPKMTQLFAIRNGLLELPDWLPQLKKLRFLSIDENKLNETPDSLGLCSSLEQISLAWNQLADLPDTFSQLKLEELSLDGNKFESVPSAILEMRSLKLLTLRACNLRKIPENINNLTNLVDLVLVNCSLETLPLALLDMPNLKWLELYPNPKLGIPDDLLRTGKPKKILNYYFTKVRPADKSRVSMAMNTPAQRKRDVLENKLGKFLDDDHNLGVDEDELVKTLSDWLAISDFTVTLKDRRSLVLKFTKLPDELDKFVRAIYEFCPDVIDQGFGCLDEMINALRETGSEPPAEMLELAEGIDFSDEDYGLEVLKRDLERNHELVLWWD